jgi:hypothetical protein
MHIFIIDFGIQMLQEVIDIKGNWKPIEYLNNLSSDLIVLFLTN